MFTFLAEHWGATLALFCVVALLWDTILYPPPGDGGDPNE